MQHNFPGTFQGEGTTRAFAASVVQQDLGQKVWREEAQQELEIARAAGRAPVRPLRFDPVPATASNVSPQARPAQDLPCAVHRHMLGQG